MSLIYVNSQDRAVSLEVPVVAVPGTFDVEVWKEDEVLANISTVTYASGKYSITLPFSLTQTDNTYSIRWRFNYIEDGETFEYNNFTEVEVVTPILPLSEINDIVKDDEDWEYKDLANLERAVRSIIQAHTGQTFGKFVGSRSITGGGESSLRLPQRLISINNINGDPYVSQSVALRGGGWFLESKVWGVPTIRADFDGWHENPYTSPAPIRHPYQRNNHIFIKNYEYAIDGVWGWNAVPESVKEAARLLVNDYACGDSMYRDRFLSSISAADWKIQFHEGAFTSTGNVRANQLLSEYVLRRGWVVV